MTPGRYAAAGAGWAIACPHATASAVGADLLRAGGNALDAAIAAAATLTVVYPHMCAVGGDILALVRTADGSLTVVNGSGAAPVGVDVAAVRSGHAQMPRRGPLAVTVPGAVRAWESIHELGASLRFGELLAPAAELAARGVPVARSLAAAIVADADELVGDRGLADLFLPEGRRLAEGERLVQPALADTLRLIAAEGAGAVYGGAVGAALVERLRAGGSAMTIGDLRAHRSELVAPIAGAFGDDTVLTAPPNSQGVLLLETIAALAAGAVRDPLGSDLDLLCELFRLTARDRDEVLADPRAVDVPLARLLSPGHGADLARRARSRRGAAPDVSLAGAPPTGDTIALVTADAAGNAVCVIQSIFDAFGSQILDPVTGVILHNRGSFFSLAADAPNVLAPGKRPVHTLMPVMVVRDGLLVGVHGTMGGKAQAQIHAQLLLRLAAGLTPYESVSAPRVVVGGGPAGSPEDLVEHEPGVAVAPLVASRFPLLALPEHSEDTGHAQLIRRAADGTFHVASDPRADGAALAG